jgi:hypothetical protein
LKTWKIPGYQGEKWKEAAKNTKGKIYWYSSEKNYPGRFWSSNEKKKTKTITIVWWFAMIRFWTRFKPSQGMILEVGHHTHFHFPIRCFQHLISQLHHKKKTQTTCTLLDVKPTRVYMRSKHSITSKKQ